MKKIHKYNFIELEDSLSEAYRNFKDSPEDEGTKTELFLAVKKIAYAILEVGSWNKLNYETISYEYALYLYERLATKSFQPEPRTNNRFPWQHYIRKNINHIIFLTQGSSQKANWMDLVEELETVANSSEDDTLDEMLDLEKNSKKLYRALLMFYSDSEIRRLLPLSVRLINSGKMGKALPNDIKDFSITCTALAKRLSSPTVDKTKDSTIKSTIFLSSVVDSSFFPKEFLLSLDIASICRLIQVSGGKTIRIPTLRELDTLLGNVLAVYEYISKRDVSDKDLVNIKDKFGLVFSNQINLKNFITNSIETYQIFDEDVEAEPLLNSMFLSIESIEKVISALDNEYLSKEIKESYSELVGSFNKFKLKMLEVGCDYL